MFDSDLVADFHRTKASPRWTIAVQLEIVNKLGDADIEYPKKGNYETYAIPGETACYCYPCTGKYKSDCKGDEKYEFENVHSLHFTPSSVNNVIPSKSVIYRDY